MLSELGGLQRPNESWESRLSRAHAAFRLVHVIICHRRFFIATLAICCNVVLVSFRSRCTKVAQNEAKIRWGPWSILDLRWTNAGLESSDHCSNNSWVSTDFSTSCDWTIGMLHQDSQAPLPETAKGGETSWVRWWCELFGGIADSSWEERPA